MDEYRFYTKKAFELELEPNEVKEIRFKTTAADERIVGILVGVEGTGQVVDATLRQQNGQYPVMRRVQFAQPGSQLADGLPMDAKGFHPLSIDAHGDVLTGTVRGVIGTGKVKVFFKIEKAQQ